MSYTIYTLTDPRDDEVKYVGATSLPLPMRLEYHLRDVNDSNKKSPRVQWLKELVRESVEPIIEEIDLIETKDSEEAGRREDEWIEFYKERCNLLNVRKGGAGLYPRDGLSRWALDRLGTMLDAEIAEHEGKSQFAVWYWRHKLEIPAYRPRNGVEWHPSSEVEEMLGQIPDSTIAEMEGVRVNAVRKTRKARGIKSAGRLLKRVVPYRFNSLESFLRQAWKQASGPIRLLKLSEELREFDFEISIRFLNKCREALQKHFPHQALRAEAVLDNWIATLQRWKCSKCFSEITLQAILEEARLAKPKNQFRTYMQPFQTWRTILADMSECKQYNVLEKSDYDVWIERLMDNKASVDKENPEREHILHKFDLFIEKLRIERDEKFPEEVT